MLWQIYTFLILISFALIVISLLTKKNNLTSSAGLLMLSAIVLGAVALYSFDVTYIECENQIGYMNVTADNVTRMTNNISCKELSYDYSPLGYLFGGMSVILLIIFMVDVFNLFRKDNTYNR